MSLITENNVTKFKKLAVIKMLAQTVKYLMLYSWRKLVFTSSEIHLLLLILVPLKLVFFCLGLAFTFGGPTHAFLFLN